MNPVTPPMDHARLVEVACEHIRTAENTPPLAELAALTGLSTFHFQRVFKRVTGLTPKAWATAHRARRMQEELAGGRSVTDAIYEAGFASNGRFHADSRRLLGMKATTYRRGGAGEVIRFALGESSLGHLLVASTDAGICAIFLGEEPQALLDDLQARFPRAELRGGDGEFERLVAVVAAQVENPGTPWTLPLDLRGTTFQLRVWHALRDIPAGTTTTYAGLAERLGDPRAVRAVAGACGANPVALAIPCHRVVRTGGALAGYRWGIERKRELLHREATRS